MDQSNKLTKYKKAVLRHTRNRLINASTSSQSRQLNTEGDNSLSESNVELTMESFEPEMESDDSDMESFEPEMELDDSDMESVEPEMNLVDSDMESLEPESELDNSDMESDDESQSDSDVDDSDVDDPVALLILQFYLRHNLTSVALDELLTLINKINKMESANIPKSKYLFHKLLPKTESPIMYYYCKNCMAYVGEKESLTREFGVTLVKCSNCQYQFNLKSKTKAEFFVQLKLKPQIEKIVRKFKDHFTKPNSENKDADTTYNDVTSGEYYKSIKKNVPDLLSFTFNTDGVRMFKSKKKSSLWPLLMVVNEVPKEHRFKRENMIVGALWYGADPDFSMFLKPFIED